MKRKLLRLAACAGTAGLVGCTGQHVTAPSGIGHRTEAITFSVGPCFGFCPVYHASITPGGAVSFAGERHTAVIGDRQRNVGAGADRVPPRGVGPAA
jgi:Domain of unknown function (DUF6438)